MSGDKPDHLPDDEELLYRCGDCLEARDWENVTMERHPDDEKQEFPICNDKPCSIENTWLPDTEGTGMSSTSDYRVDDTIE